MVYCVSVGGERDGGVLGELDEFFGDEAHERADAAGVGERESGGGSGGVGVDFQEPGDGDGHGRVRGDGDGSGALQRGQEEVERYSSLTDTPMVRFFCFNSMLFFFLLKEKNKKKKGLVFYSYYFV